MPEQDLGRARLRLVTDETGMVTGLRVAREQALTSVRGIQQSLTAAGAAMSNTGRQLTAGVTLPIVAAGAAIFTVGKNYEQTLNQIVGLTDVTRGELGKINGDIRAIAEETGRAPQELAEAFYFVASAGFSAAEATEVLRTSAIASAAGLGRTQDIAKVLGLTINAYGKENITASRAADILTAAVKDGTAEADAFAGVLGRVVPTAATLGVTFDQVAAALAGMTLTGLSAEEAATSLNQVLVSLLKPTREAEAAMEGMGLSAQGLRTQLREEGLLATLRTLEERFGANEEAASQVFGNVRALRGVLSLLTLDADQLNDVFKDTAVAQGDLAAGYADTEGTARDYERTQARIQGALIDLSKDVMPVVLELLESLADIVEDAAGWFADLSPEVRDTVVHVAALAALAGPLLVFAGSMLSAAGAMGKLVLATGPLIPLFAYLSGEAGKLNQVMAESPAETYAREIEDIGHIRIGPIDLTELFATKAGADDAAAAVRNLAMSDLGNFPGKMKDDLAPITPAFKEAAKEGPEAYRQRMRDALAKALTDQSDYTADALAMLRKFRTDIESAYGDAQDAALDFARTTVRLGQLQIELSAQDDEYAKKLKKLTPQQVAEYRLRRAEIVAEMNALKLHLALIGDDIQKTTALKSLLASKEMRDGLTSEMPETQAAYRALRDEAIEKLNEIARKGGPASKHAAQTIAKYMDPSNPISPFNDSASWGSGTGSAFTSALSRALRVTPEMRAAMGRIAGFLEADSPPKDPSNPLHTIDRWGERTGLAWLDPFVGVIRSASRRIQPGLSDAAAMLSAPMSGPGLAFAAAGAGIGPDAGFARNVPILPAQASDVARAATGGNTYNTTLVIPDAKGHDAYAVFDRLGRDVRWGRLPVANIVEAPS